MLRALPTVLAIAATTLLAPTASAQEAAIRDDIRCLMLMGAVTQAQNQQMAGAMGVAYYLGRLEGRLPPAALESRILAEAQSIRPEDLKADAPRCGGEMQAIGRRFQDLGKKIQERTTTKK